MLGTLFLALQHLLPKALLLQFSCTRITFVHWEASVIKFPLINICKLKD